MPCYHPIAAYRPRLGGSLIFADRGDCDPLSIACGQCIGCRLERSRQWAMRCMHEASMWETNCFVTLTYDDAHLPARGQLVYSDFQLFVKRLRKFADPVRVRFYMCGEYGPLNWRPHFHACFFGFDLADKVYHSTSGSGERLFSSVSLSELWPYGFSSVGQLTFESAAYVARYCVAKRTGKGAEAYYSREDSEGVYFLEPEFNGMSLKPGIGAEWLERFRTDVFPRDYVVVRGVKCRVPAYYDRLFGREFPDDLDQIKQERVLSARERVEDNTDERLAVREIVQRARSSLLYRSDT